MSDEERAAELFRVGKNMTSCGFMRTGTVWLISACTYAPDNTEYNDYLVEVYDGYWKDADFSKEEIIAEDFMNIQKSAKEIVEEYQKERP